MTTLYCLRFETPPSWRVRSPYLYAPGTGWPGYTPRHLVPFSSPPTTRRATVEVFEPTSCLQNNSSARTTQKTHSLSCCRGLFTAPLHNNGRGTDHIENELLILLRTCMYRALPSNGRCLHSNCLITGLYATIIIIIIIIMREIIHLHHS
jgi:hypothetical protein